MQSEPTTPLTFILSPKGRGKRIVRENESPFGECNQRCANSVIPSPLGLSITHIFKKARIPKGFWLIAQGCEARATLGKEPDVRQPQQGCDLDTELCHNPVGVATFSSRYPRVSRSSQPWAGGHNPFGISWQRIDVYNHQPPWGERVRPST